MLIICYKRNIVTNTKRESKWEELFGHQPKERDWSIIHRDNFRCTIETQLRSFYFKIFHNVIGVNAFLFKIIRKRDSPNCYFCSEEPETLDHLFCNCTKVVPLWENLVDKIYTSSGISRDIVFTKFNYLFGIHTGSRHDSCINVLFLYLKFYIYSCKFQEKELRFEVFRSMVKSKQNVEYKIAKKKEQVECSF